MIELPFPWIRSQETEHQRVLELEAQVERLRARVSELEAQLGERDELC